MIIGSIKEFIQYEGVHKKTVYKDDRVQAMVLSLKEGEELKPHISTTDAFFIVTEGEAVFMLMGTAHHLTKGQLCSFKAKQLHSVKALTDFSMLLVK